MTSLLMNSIKTTKIEPASRIRSRKMSLALCHKSRGTVVCCVIGVFSTLIDWLMLLIVCQLGVQHVADLIYYSVVQPLAARLLKQMEQCPNK